MPHSTIGFAPITAFLLLLAVSFAVRADEPADQFSARKVLIIGIDGTRPDALAKAKTPHLDSLIEQGAFTDTAQILGTRYDKNNTISGPGWSSILTGVWADKHGVHDNSFDGRNYELFPHFFKRLKRSRPDAKTFSFVSWEPIGKYIVSEADLNHIEPLPPSEGATLDLNVSADELKIETRDGQWHHLLAVRKGKTVRLFLDGQLIAEPQHFGDAYDLAGDFMSLGRDTRAGKTGFRGQLDEIRFWKRALSDDEILATAQAQTPAHRAQLLAEYTFDSQDEPLADSAKGQDGTFSAQAVTEQQSFRIRPVESSSDKPDAKSNRVLDLSENGGADHGLRVALKKPFRGLTQGDFTVEARFRTTDSGRNILLGNFASNIGALNLELHTGNKVRLYLQPPKPTPHANLAREDRRDEIIADKAAGILRQQDPTAMFVYLHQVDSTGHTIGFSPAVPEYLRAIENVDGYIGRLLKAIRERSSFDKEDWLILVCTDHGGIRTTHSNGQKIPEIRKVFLIASGPSVKPGRIARQAYLVDVAVTALTHLTGPVDPKWELDGQPFGIDVPQNSN